MLLINEAVEKFEGLASQVIKVIYGFATDASAPILKYDIKISSDEANSIRNKILRLGFECLLVGEANTKELDAKIKILQTARALKDLLVANGFVFLSIEDALVFDGEGKTTDNPALLINFAFNIEF